MNLLDFFAGYGVRPRRLVVLWLLMFLVHTAVFSSRLSVERPIGFGQPRTDTIGGKGMRPELPGKLVVPNPWPADGGRPGPGEWDVGHAFFVALRIQVPFLSLLSEGDWEPAGREMIPNSAVLGWTKLTFENYAAAASALNLLVVPLAIAGLAGLLKRDK